MSEAARLASIAGADGSSPLLHTDTHDWEASQALRKLANSGLRDQLVHWLCYLTDAGTTEYCQGPRLMCSK